MVWASGSVDVEEEFMEVDESDVEVAGPAETEAGIVLVVEVVPVVEDEAEVVLEAEEA